jgi:predicted nucleotidyltransferase
LAAAIKEYSVIITTKNPSANFVKSMQLAQAVIDNLITRIKRVIEPEQVIIFGSAARGLMAPDSDIDVLVVIPKGIHRFHTCQAIHRQLSGFGFPVDVVVANKEVLDKHKNNPGLIYQNILKEGKTDYAA